jgi:redox-sensitive bicupin YhaK (pirin superfamily)
LYSSILGAGEQVTHTLAAGRFGWLQVARGSVRLNGETLTEGDGAAISGESEIRINGIEESEVLLFDLA